MIFKANRFGCEAIVIGSRKGRLVRRFFQGGTAKKVLIQTKKPVFLVFVNQGIIEVVSIDGN